MKANSKSAAWEIADEIFPTDYILNDGKSERAGYSIYTSTAEGESGYICDLGDRLEVNYSDGRSVNIWICESEAEAEEASVLPKEYKTVGIAITYEKTGRNSKVTVTRNAEVSFGIETTFDSIARFLDDAKKVVSGYKYCAKNALYCKVYLHSAVYKRDSGTNRLKSYSFDGWQFDGIPEYDSEGLYLTPDAQYTRPEHDIWIDLAEPLLSQLAEANI